MWECEQNYDAGYCMTKVCFNGSTTVVAAPYPVTTATCTNKTVTTTCGSCASGVNCGSCGNTAGESFCLENSCTYSNATVTNQPCDKTDMFGNSVPCCNTYVWNDPSGNNGICTAGTTLAGYNTYLANYLGIDVLWSALDISRMTLLAIIALFLAANQL